MSNNKNFQLPDIQARDAFFWYCRMDMASTVAALRSGIITSENAALTAKAVTAVMQDGAQPGADRPTDYLGVQAMLLKKSGSEGSRMHSGRSRQDMLAVLHRTLIRDRVLNEMHFVNRVRSGMLALAEEHRETLVPAYTNGVQAQPVTFGHLLLGYEAALGRSARRIIEGYSRLNLSPLGAAALATSRFPVDRPLLAQLLGFDGCVENAFDAAQISIVDVGSEAAYHASLIALTLGTFVQDIHAQFHHARNWIFLDASGNISPSTLMPQKRNPVVLNRARLLGSEVVGASFTAALAGHNVCSGMTDYKRADAARTIELVVQMMHEVLDVLSGIRVDTRAADAEIAAEYSTTSDLAAALQELKNIPLAIGHKFSSLLVDYGRKELLPLSNIPFSVITDIYSKAADQFADLTNAAFPFSESEFQMVISPRTMVEGYRGLGGSAPVEVTRLLAKARMMLTNDEVWLQKVIELLQDAESSLDLQFSHI